MQYVKGIGSYHDSSRTAVTLGKFDGLHRGHHKLINRIQEHAAGGEVKSVVVAFDMRVLEKKRGTVKPKVMTNEERAHLLEDEVDYLIECPFTEDISMMEANDFIEEILVKRLRAKYIVIGADFRFGHNRQGDAMMLKEYEKRSDFKVEIIEKEKFGDRVISSTYVKEVLPTGNMELVRELLGYPYTIVGEVVHGNRIGRTLGIPTMNLTPDKDKLLPPFGVYVCQVKCGGQWHAGICNIGKKPTVGDDERLSIECHLFGYSGDTYGQQIEVRIYRRERGEQKFAGIPELKAQMKKDIEKGKEYFDYNR